MSSSGPVNLQLPPGVDIYSIPLQSPPPGVQSNFTKPPELRVLLIAALSIMLPLMTLFLALRVYIRFGRGERWRMDDWFAVVTAIFIYATSGVSIAGINVLGHKGWDVSLGTMSTAFAQRIILSEHGLTGACFFLGKMCLLTMYYRIFGHIGRVRKQLWVTGILSFWSVIAGLISVACILPPKGTPWGTPNPLYNVPSHVSLATGILHLIVDAMILYIPLPIITKLKLSKEKRRGILGLFLTGMIAVASDIVSLWVRVETQKGTDVIRFGFVTIVCCIIESSISVILSSLPCTAKFWKLHIESLRVYQSLRSHFGSQGSSNESTRRGLPSWFQKPPTEKKRHDPWSIGLPTTNMSTTQLSYDQGLALSPSKLGTVKANVSAGYPDGNVSPHDIEFRTSLEQTSITYPDSCKTRNEHSAV